jgi:formate hydrogenlyase transcriptional activator
MTNEATPFRDPEEDPRFVALRRIAEGTAYGTGQAFFNTLVEHLAQAINMRHAFVAELLPNKHLKTLAYWSNGSLIANIDFPLRGTPCEEAWKSGVCVYCSGLRLAYPNTEGGLESYIGVPLHAPDGRAVGHLAAFDDEPLPELPHRLTLFRIFATRAASELERSRLESTLRAQEDQLTDLFEEAPIAYVHERKDTRFIRANRAARELLGITAEEVPHVTGASLVPNKPDAQRRLQEARRLLSAGSHGQGINLELCRKDNGQPVWIQWWSRPARAGNYTRSMLVDITERVLLEQEQARLTAQNLYLREELKSVHNFEEIIGASAGLLRVMGQVSKVAPTDASVLISGETGTGKELIARALHSGSPRAEKPFIKVNCAALPEGLVESELFGHERGAFSGAIQRRIGRFELAHTGSIFLDEIGELPLDVQVKLLRFLQEREFERIGSSQPIKTDVRIIAATNRDLHKQVAQGEFRADLFYRLNVFPIMIPPLRERKADIPLLTHFFVQKYAPRIGRRIESVDAEGLRRLIEYPWPGNIRELENIIERSLILNDSEVLQVEAELLTGTTAKATTTPPSVLPAASGSDLNSVQREHILNTLRDANWVIEGEHGAAVRLGLNSATLRHRMKKLGIERSRNK